MAVLVGGGGEPVPVKSWPLGGRRQVRDLGYSMPRSIDLVGGNRISYDSLYRSQLWVWACVTTLSQLAAMLPLKSYQRQDDGGRERLPDSHALPSLIESPYPRGTKFDLVESLVGQLAIHANALAVKWRPSPGAPPTELWPVPWRYISPIEGTNEPIAGYRYRGPAGERTFVPDDVVHLQLWGGISPLEPLRDTLAAEFAGRQYERGSFEHGARPSGALIAPQRLKPDQREKLRSEFDADYSGTDPRFRTLLLDGGLEWRQMSYSAQEAEALGYRRLNREEVASAYRIPQPAVGILDRATFSNVTEQHRMLYQDTLGPWLQNFESAFVAQLIRSEPAWAGMFVEFALDGVLRGNPKERSESTQRGFQSASVTPNEQRAMENRPPIDHPAANTVWAPMNMVPLLDGEDVEVWSELMGRKAENNRLRDIALAAQQLANAVDKTILTKEEARTMLASAMEGAGVGEPIDPDGAPDEEPEPTTTPPLAPPPPPPADDATGSADDEDDGEGE